MKIFCVIPAYNEARNIGRVLSEVKKYIENIVVVDDCSSDATFVVAKDAGVAVLRHVVNRGQGAALQTGNDYALSRNADIIVHFDADGQFLAEEIKDLVSVLENDRADVVFGSRFLDKKSDMPWSKSVFIMPSARAINRLFLGVKNMTDPQSGFRAMTASAARQIIIKQDRMAHCSEILSKVFNANLRVKEVPITVLYHNFGQKFSGGLKILKDLFVGSLLK